MDSTEKILCSFESKLSKSGYMMAFIQDRLMYLFAGKGVIKCILIPHLKKAGLLEILLTNLVCVFKK